MGSDAQLTSEGNCARECPGWKISKGCLDFHAGLQTRNAYACSGDLFHPDLHTQPLTGDTISSESRPKKSGVLALLYPKFANKILYFKIISDYTISFLGLNFTAFCNI